MTNKKKIIISLFIFVFAILLLSILLNINTIRKSADVLKKDIESEITQIINNLKQEKENKNINEIDSDTNNVTIEDLKEEFLKLGYDLNISTGEVIYKDHIVVINSDLTIASIEEMQTKAYYTIYGISNEKLSSCIVLENPKGISKILVDGLEFNLNGKKKFALDRELEINKAFEIEVTLVGNTTEKYKIMPVSQPEIQIISHELSDDLNTRNVVLNFNNLVGENVNITNYYSLDKGETWTQYNGETINIDLNNIDTIATKTTKTTLDNSKEIKSEQLPEINYEYTNTSLLDWTKWYLFENGYYNTTINGVPYSIHGYVYNGYLNLSSNTTYGDSNDIGTSNSNAKNTVVVKVNGSLTVNSGVTLTAAGSAYGGPKGLLLYVSEDLTNNGTISMTARGAKAVGQNVYLYKSSLEKYELVPAAGGLGGAAKYVSGYNAGVTGINRQTGGGGSGQANGKTCYSGAGSSGTSYSGGSGGRWLL